MSVAIEKSGRGNDAEFSIVLDIHVNAKKKPKTSNENYTVPFFLKEMLIC